MQLTVHPVPSNEIESVIPLLLLAEPSDGALRWGLSHLSDTVYRLDADGELVGAASMRWQSDPSELQELAVAPNRQGQGLGKYLVQWLIDEAGRRKRSALLVGTSNAAIDNIAFYQKCGFRMDHVRKDYFRYYREPIYANGIQVRDLLMFRYELTA